MKVIKIIDKHDWLWCCDIFFNKLF